MAAATSTPAPGEIACPDPSAHEHHEQQQRQSAAASTAALYATHPERNTSGKDSPLGPDGKLSSRSAATSLKYAQPQDLPSFPSRGGKSSAASTAAHLAQDHKMKELWHHETSAAGSRAAVLAARDGGKVDPIYQPTSSSIGNSAASLAMKNKNLSPQLDRGYNDTGRTNSMLAATKSHNQSRQRAGSMPVARPDTYPDQQNSSKNALNAATVSHRTSTKMAPDGWSSEANQAARVKNMHMDREMFGDHPPVEPEREEQRHQAALRASAVSMAKSMMEYQNRQAAASDPETSSLRLDSAGANTAHRRNQSSLSQPDIKEEAIRYIHLQDAAHKLAQERLAKVDKDMEHGKYREYYGYSSQAPRNSRFSVRGRTRKRASSEGQYFEDSDDEEQARRIRTQMSQLSTAQNEIDNKQRKEDRARVMAAAEKRVHAQMHDMDEKVYFDTGKVSQSMMDEWEAKARDKAEKSRAERAQHPGKTHIGGGKYMDDSEIEAIAAARLKPTLDELNDTAEKKRARDEEIRAKMDRQETERMQEKMNDRDARAEFKRIKDQDKAAARKEKEDRKAAKRAEKEAEKARKAEEKRKSREHKRDEVAAVTGGAALAEVVDKAKQDEEEHKKEQTVAGSALAEALEKSKEEDEKERLDRVATADTLAEVAEKVKTHDEPTHQGESRGIAAEPDRSVVVAPVVVPVTESVERREDAREEPRQVVKEQPKEKPERRSMFGSIKNRFQRKEHDESVVEEPKKSAEGPVPAVQEEEKHDDGAATAPILSLAAAAGLAAAADSETDYHRPGEQERGVDDAYDKHDAASAAAAAPANNLQGTGPVAVGGVEEEHPAREAAEDEDIDKVEMAGAIAGTAALGAVVAAGSMEAEQRKSTGSVDREEHISEVSSLSTTDSELSDSEDERDLEGVVTANEHSGDYNFAAPSPAVERRPDIMRHISTIESSSGSEPEDSPDFTDLDEEPGRLEPRPTMVEDFRGREGAPVRDTPLMIDHIPSRVDEEPDSPVSPLHQDEEDPVEDGKVVIVNRDATPQAPQHDAVPGESASVAESGAPAPVVRSGPRDEERKMEKEKEKKEGGGVRGFFRKLKNKSKAENKLQKRQHSATGSETSLAGAASTERETEKSAAAAPTGEQGSSKDDEFTTPVTTTAGMETQQHMGTDGPIGDPKHISGLGGEPRAASPSSFERYRAEPQNLDDVSSSGADEDDVSRGRTGKLTKRLGLKTDKGKATANDGAMPQSATSRGDEDQFEEARDQFDESLAPPPSFGGQLKSSSPIRETRFQEQL